jgi:hypothetical protein
MHFSRETRAFELSALPQNQIAMNPSFVSFFEANGEASN